MKYTHLHVFIQLSLSISISILKLVGAQRGGQNPPPPDQAYSTFSPSLAVIVSILIAALVFMLFFSIYARHCSPETAVGGAVRRGISLRSRRAVVARGLDASVIETFPTFSYSEVKDHNIGYKDAPLECAVCLNEFEDEETLLLIPKCDHVFHPECIGAWLEAHVTCPVCRADLVPKPGEEPVSEPAPVHDRTDSLRSDEAVMIRMEADGLSRARVVERNMSLENANRPQRSWSMKMFGFDKFRSRSTGHSMVRPGENLDRFTLRLPVQVRKEILNRTGSRASLPREGSLRRGYIGDGSGRNGRSFGRFDRDEKSDRWVFLRRGSSMKSPKSVGEMEQAGSSSRRPVKMPSFRCLEPKADDETGLASHDQLARNSE